MEPIRLRFTPESKDYSRVMLAHSVRTRVLWISFRALVRSKLPASPWL